eukprot:4806878-Prorocentrum_lima.AAC.1
MSPPGHTLGAPGHAKGAPVTLMSPPVSLKVPPVTLKFPQVTLRGPLAQQPKFNQKFTFGSTKSLLLVELEFNQK